VANTTDNQQLGPTQRFVDSTTTPQYSYGVPAQNYGYNTPSTDALTGVRFFNTNNCNLEGISNGGNFTADCALNYFITNNPGYNVGNFNSWGSAGWTSLIGRVQVSRFYPGIRHNFSSQLGCYGRGDCFTTYEYVFYPGYAHDFSGEGRESLRGRTRTAINCSFTKTTLARP
jgi:hypothetical protein